MAISFKSQTQRGMYDAVLRGLNALGYCGDLLIEDYQFGDWFAHSVPERTIPAAAFGQTPVSSDSACFGVAIANGLSRSHLISQYRALGAPIIFEVSDDTVREWAVGHKTDDACQVGDIQPAQLGSHFADNAADWAPGPFLRAKNIGDFHWCRQLELFSGVLPELEHQIADKLDPMLRAALSAASKEYRTTTGKQPEDEKLFQLVFWLLTGKVFHDRQFEGFAEITPTEGNADTVLEAVAGHYKTRVPRLLTRTARDHAFLRIWLEMDFRNLSVEVLSHIWSKTLVTEDLRKKLGIHRTPRSLVRYIVERVPLETVGDDHRIVLEPCCGSATFLVSAMNRLRSLLWGQSPEERHDYFIQHLVGFEKDPFGVEVSRLSLALADFPNPDGWQVNRGDVFDRTGGFPAALQQAGIVLCNPPFGDFSPEERARYSPDSVRKPVELLNRVLDHLHPQGVLGFILPRNILDGRGYKAVRRKLATRFASLEVTSLPDRVFDADHESAVLIATEPLPHHRAFVTHRKVRDATVAWQRFEWRHEVSSEDTVQLDIDDAENSIAVPELEAVWKRLRHYRKLRDLAETHRGIEWNLPLTVEGEETGNRDLLVRDKTDEEGFVLGVPPKASPFHCFQIPPLKFLDMRPESQRGSAYDRPWDRPKAILNSLTKSRGPWRLAAFADTQGLPCYQTFTGVWPRSDVDPVALAALLNGPIANAFVATREGKKHITIETLEAIPVPHFTEGQLTDIRRLVSQYLSATKRRDAQRPEQLLKRIDAVVLAAYALPPRTERLLLDFFNGQNRPVPFTFSDYFPPDFTPCFPLGEYLSPDFHEATAGRLLERANGQ